jgi:hypothetical protein
MSWSNFFLEPLPELAVHVHEVDYDDTIQGGSRSEVSAIYGSREDRGLKFLPFMAAGRIEV